MYYKVSSLAVAAAEAQEGALKIQVPVAELLVRPEAEDLWAAAEAADTEVEEAVVVEVLRLTLHQPGKAAVVGVADM